MNKIERELYGPGWGEVLLGVALSLVLGVVLAAVSLTLKPVKIVKELPKDIVEGAVYYVEGVRATATSAAEAKRRTFTQGGSVELSEGELNVLLGGKPPAPKPKAAAPAKEPAKEEAAPGKMLTAGSPNFRIQNGILQVALPLHVSLLGFDDEVIAQARGGFEKAGSGVVFVPSEFYIGSCPVQRLPGVADLLIDRILAVASVPQEFAGVWSRVSDATVEGSVLHLTVR